MLIQAFLSGSPVLLFLRLFLVYHLVQLSVALFLNLDSLHSWGFVKRAREGSANLFPGLAWVLRYYLLSTITFLILICSPWWLSLNQLISSFLVQYSPSLNWLPYRTDLTSILVDLLLGLLIYKTLTGIVFAMSVCGVRKLREFMEFVNIRWFLFPLRLITFCLFWVVGISRLKASSDSFQPLVRPQGDPEKDALREAIFGVHERAWVFSKASRPSDLFLAILLAIFSVLVYRPDFSVILQFLWGGWAFLGFVFLLGALDKFLLGEHSSFFLEGFFAYRLVEKISPHDQLEDD